MFNENLWWVYDGGIAVILLVFIFISIRKNLIKNMVSFAGFLLAAAVAFSVSGGIAESVYKGTTRDSNIKTLSNKMDSEAFINELAFYLEDLDYSLNINTLKFEETLRKDDKVSENIYKYVNNVNGRVVDTAENFEEKLHEGYADVFGKMTERHISKYALEFAKKEIVENPSAFEKLVPLMLDNENMKPAAEYICTNFIDNAYINGFRITVFTILLVVIIIVTILIAGAFGKNDKMEKNPVQHFFCALLGIGRGAVVAVGVTAVIRLSEIYGDNAERFFGSAAVDKTYVFKYIYDLISNMK